MTSNGLQRRAVGRIGGVILAALVGFGSLAAHADEVVRGDFAWARRAEGEREGRPLPGPIREAVRSYESALTSRPLERRTVRRQVMSWLISRIARIGFSSVMSRSTT